VTYLIHFLKYREVAYVEGCGCIVVRPYNLIVAELDTFEDGYDLSLMDYYITNFFFKKRKMKKKKGKEREE
jgi:hypothetical protein